MARFRAHLLTVCLVVMMSIVPALSENKTCTCLEDQVEPAPSGLDALPLAVRLVMIVVLVGFSGLFSGLTLGLMGLDVIGLQVVMNGDDKAASAAAAKIKPVRMRGNELLCTLLLGNVAVNSALAILADKIFTGLAGFLISTGLIVVFGEIIPQATCAQYALQIGARTVCIVKVLMLIFFPLTKPMSMVLDVVLGKDAGQIFTTSELMEMVKLQVKLGSADEETGIMAKQVVEGVINFREKKATEVMTPVQDLYMLSEETTLSYKQVREIFDNGYSRIPVYGKSKNDVKGLLYTKDLMLADPEDEMRLGDFIRIFGRKTECLKPSAPLLDVLNALKKGSTHIGLIWDMEMASGEPTAALVGAVTMEDIMEEILSEEIVDETDKFRDNRSRTVVDDGRASAHADLGVLNPVWTSQGSSVLNPDEVNAVASHLKQTVFSGSDNQLDVRTIKWMIGGCEVRNKTRKTEAGLDEPLMDDLLFSAGVETDLCAVVLQGRFGLRVGCEKHRAEAGAFRVLGKGALFSQTYTPDFDAFVGSPQVRYLLIPHSKFVEARAKNNDKSALEIAERALAQKAAAESSRREPKLKASKRQNSPLSVKDQE